MTHPAHTPPAVNRSGAPKVIRSEKSLRGEIEYCPLPLVRNPNPRFPCFP